MLNQIHLALKKADPNKSKVMEIAQEFGTLHLGQFAKDYKKLFGELPSKTLKRD